MGKKRYVFNSYDPQQTIQWGSSLGNMLFPGSVVALSGDLGSGKTVLAKGIAKGVEVSEPHYVTSPSFTLINEYNGKFPFYHMDFYRLKNGEEAILLGIEEYLYGDGVVVIEWAENIASYLPEELMKIELEYLDECARRLYISWYGKRYEEIVKKMKHGGIKKNQWHV
ncbi:MAG: tRNA (adenosine(37)-N6)-threonylcarbamoyltransferase complex ATPase subunit type 1 TsaE [Thermodesulfobacteriota bacterium]|nr:tRNA (adenosine(37)-N6)-threonylcarbamoyltransferase complex ATPase subunit type 1 TsaE [Thermodesulfobacteriota bacterium]